MNDLMDWFLLNWLKWRMQTFKYKFKKKNKILSVNVSTSESNKSTVIKY